MDIENIPQNIKESLFSERVDEILDKIREEAGIFDTSLIPSIYYNLITKEIPAHYFVESLAETGIGEKIAKSIAKAIKERILESERFPLFKWGVDISEIKVEDAPDLSTLGLSEFIKEEPTKKEISLKEANNFIESIPIVKGIKDNVQPKSISTLFQNQKKDVEKEESPLILQQKEESSEIESNKEKIFPSLSLGQIGFFKLKRESPQKNPEVSQKIKAEIKTPKEEKKVVHYSETRTILDPWQQQNNNFIKIEPSIAASSKEDLKEPTKETTLEKVKEKNDEEKENTLQPNTNNTAPKSVEIIEEQNIINLKKKE